MLLDQSGQIGRLRRLAGARVLDLFQKRQFILQCADLLQQVDLGFVPVDMGDHGVHAQLSPIGNLVTDRPLTGIGAGCFIPHIHPLERHGLIRRGIDGGFGLVLLVV